jgi:hypothetical protein
MRASAGLSGSKHQPTSEGFTIQLKTDAAAPAPRLSAAIYYLTLPGLTG